MNLKDLLGDVKGEHILEHHSNFIDDINCKRSWYIRKLQMDNWDAPIIFTTMVQYLNIFFENSAQSTRRLHRLLNSVVIFDEIQAIPPKTVHMFNETLNFMKSVVGSTGILCTATQPSLTKVKNRIIHEDGDIVTLSPEELAVFDRVKPEIRLESKWSNEQLVDEILQSAEDGSVLCIFNTKKTANNALQSLKLNNQGIEVYYLTKDMCAAQRLDVLSEIREKLRNKERVILLSTSLIEAGVDVSFQTVYRAVAGFDSLIQAIGRCNRHGELGMGRFVVFSHKDDDLSFSPELSAAQHEAYILCKQLMDAPQRMFEQPMITKYFDSYYNALKSSFLNYPIFNNAHNLYDLLFSSNQKYITGESLFQLRAAHRTVGKHFKSIDQDQDAEAVIVPYKEGTKIIEKIRAEKIEGNIYKKAQRYLINIYRNKFDELVEEGFIEKKEIDGSIFYLLDKNVYSDSEGLEISSKNNKIMIYCNLL